MAPQYLSVVSLFSSYIRHCFKQSGLLPQTIAIDDKTSMSVWCPKHEKIDPQKENFVLIHGFGLSSMWSWRRQVMFFAPYFNVYVPDLLFLGKSTTNSPERSEIFQAECVVKLLEKLKVRNYNVLGISYGGFVTYQMAKLWPERVVKVVIVNCGINAKRSTDENLVLKAQIDNLAELFFPTTVSQCRSLFALCVYKNPVRIPDFVINDLIKQFKINREEKLELIKGVTFGREERVDVAPIQQEVLLLWGEYDQIFPVKMAEELQMLLGKNVKLHIIKNARHVLQLEKTREFNKVVNDFLSHS